MSASPDDVEWARLEAQRLRTQIQHHQISFGVTGKGIEFLRLHAGPRSAIYKKASSLNVSSSAQMRAVADLLDGWADLVADGHVEAEPQAVTARIAAATDLMEQVDLLLKDPKMHAAAPVMLAGAALEEYLRGLVDGDDEIPMPSKPSIATYGQALRKAERITAADINEITALASIRNDAAHGVFANVSAERARIMADRVNLFLRQKVGG